VCGRARPSAPNREKTGFLRIERQDPVGQLIAAVRQAVPHDSRMGAVDQIPSRVRKSAWPTTCLVSISKGRAIDAFSIFPRACLGTFMIRTRGAERRAMAAIQRERQATRGDRGVELGDSRTAFTNEGASPARAAGIGSAILGLLALLMAARASIGPWLSPSRAGHRKSASAGPWAHNQ
jgi:hypothetical protein